MHLAYRLPFHDQCAWCRKERPLDTRKILLIGDIPAVEPELRERPDYRYEIHRAPSKADALAMMKSASFDVLVGDVNASTESARFMDSLQRFERRPVVISAAAHYGGGSEDKWEAADVHEHLEAPLTTSKILHSIQRAIEHADLVRRNRELEARIRDNDSLESLVGSSKVMESVRERLRLVAASNAAVIITGETGSGKELAAREIHRLSGCRGPWVKLDCAAAPEGVLEEQLFGCPDHAGLLERARGGTLLLDEVERLPLHAQTRFVRVLEGEECEPVDTVGSGPKRSVRIVSTTRRDLNADVTEGLFRGDLYYCLGVVPITMPALRDRREDIPLLIGHFLERLNRQRGPEPVRLSSDAVDKLRNAHWRGNIRELQNALERAVLLSPATALGADAFHFDNERDEHRHQVGEAFRLGSVREMERLMILNRLRENDDNRTRAAKSLDISVRTLRNKLRDYRQTRDV